MTQPAQTGGGGGSEGGGGVNASPKEKVSLHRTRIVLQLQYLIKTSDMDDKQTLKRTDMKLAHGTPHFYAQRI